MVYALPLTLFAGGLILGHFLGRNGAGRTAAGLFAACLLVVILLVFAGRAQANGWDAIGYAIFAFLMVAPLGLGIGAGAMIGLYRQGKARQKPPHD